MLVGHAGKKKYSEDAARPDKRNRTYIIHLDFFRFGAFSLLRLKSFQITTKKKNYKNSSAHL